MMKQQWTKFNGDPLQRPIKREIIEVLRREKEKGYVLKVCIGTDSQIKRSLTHFATVIVFLRHGKGGFMFIRHDTMRQQMGIKQRMLAEVAKTIEVAYPLCPVFSDFEVDMEIHADINSRPQFRSNHALQEAMGFILGMGFAFRAKPDAFASSCCADKFVH